ncbi:copper homeostasis protein CutC [Arsenicibacter rosenii]|uniref:PF03932 family protein CutC n=1 Tax=Arsenicibacter rosenii TaxID=1750698 RepID=A0A1S2VCR8_9BACT|nr:copper homeostasis protein CutC [Arsenicibacter rosenii]OIN56479.1 copper homeostasis protein CutC [Arsenicibacter rosenii]
MTIEVCAFSLSACLTAQEAGAGRIELCGGFSEGGTTPSAGLIQQARQQLQIPIYVMIRPRGGDFLYSAAELDVMKADIEVAKQLGADGIVLGLLNPDGTVDEENTRMLIDQAKPLGVTFHRAFDMAADPFEALEAVIRTGAERILTSGQQPSVQTGLPLLKELARRAAGRLEIMAGAGVNAQNATQLKDAGVHALHLSGKRIDESPMIFRQPNVSMASAALGEYERVEADAPAISAVVGQVSH